MIKPFHLMMIEEDRADFHHFVSACRSVSIPCDIDWQTTGEFGLLALKEAERGGVIHEVVVIDFDLPGMAGSDVLRHIRHNRRLRSVSTLVLTRNSSPSEIAFAAWSDRSIVKPIMFVGWLEVAAMIRDLAAQQRDSAHMLSRRWSSRYPHVLYVDDEPDCRNLFARASLFSGLPAMIHSLGSVAEAMGYLNRVAPRQAAIRPKLIVYAPRGPLGIGSNLLHSIRTNDMYRTITVIVIIDSEDASCAGQYRASGADEIFMAPRTYRGLIELISSFDRLLVGSSHELPV
jgi:DNA-binding response OmpR family regulator